MATQHYFLNERNSFIPVTLSLFFLFSGIVSANQKQIAIQSAHSSGGPRLITVDFIISKDSLVAGKPIPIVISLTNSEGLWPGTWCCNAVYRDAYDTMRRGNYTPSVSFSSQDTTSAFLGSVCRECFKNGTDTAKIILYSAPFTQDTLHQIAFDLDTENTVFFHASSNPFVLLPGPVDSISIENGNYEAIAGPETLSYPNGMRLFYSNGYDQYKNFIGHVNTDWTATAMLHAIDAPTQNISRIMYQSVDDDEAGFIVAQTVSPRTGKLVSDSVEVIIHGHQTGVQYKFNAPTSIVCVLRVFNALGKLVYQRTIREPQTAHTILSGLHLKRGIYFISLKGGSANIIRKMPITE